MGLTTSYGTLGHPVNRLAARGTVPASEDGWLPARPQEPKKSICEPGTAYVKTVHSEVMTHCFDNAGASKFLPQKISVLDRVFEADGWHALFKVLAETYIPRHY